jgi:hypothetical protein
MLNHSATHLFHAALREVLGEHVRQAGSLVAPDRLRFDFSHFSQLTGEEISQIEDLVNAQVRRNLAVRTFEIPYREAIARGALAFFGDRYPERVRVVEMGDWSLELCGGTHVRQTGEIGYFKITSESGIAADTRRVEAVTGEAPHVREEEIGWRGWASCSDGAEGRGREGHALLGPARGAGAVGSPRAQRRGRAPRISRGDRRGRASGDRRGRRRDPRPCARSATASGRSFPRESSCSARAARGRRPSSSR